MLTLRLRPYAPDQTWSWDGTRYRTECHSSQVAPYPHPLVESLAATDGSRTLIVVRERLAGRAPCSPAPRAFSPGEYDQACAAVRSWPGDFVLVENTPHAPVVVTAGALGVAPIYLACDGDTLVGSWDMADLRAFATGLCPKEAARLLVYRPRYSNQTLFQGIHRLTERSTAHFGGALYLCYPTPAPHGGPRALAEDADVLTAFDQAMDDALQARPLEPARTVFHLTGGFDSATVATRAAAHWPEQLATATLLIDGPGRLQQIRRRQQIRDAAPFGPVDQILDAAAHLPLDPGCARVRGEPVSPYEEPLHRPFTLMTAALAKDGAHTVVTGLGGDEMVALSAHEQTHPPLGPHTATQPWIGANARAALEYADDQIAPPARVNSMTLLSLETTAPPLLRAGIWPLHPFATPAMVQLGEWLPLCWRDFKQLQRRRLARLGLGDDVVHPRHRESFAEIVQNALTRHGVRLLADMLAHGSPLFDDKLIDPDALTQARARLEAGDYHEDREAQLLEVITLHLAATAYQ